MAKTYTLDDIDKISRTRTASAGVLYEATTGEFFVGTSRGNLIFVPNADSIHISSIFGVEADDVQGALSELSARTDVVEGDYVTEEELAAAERRARCFSIAISTIL